MLFRNCTLIIAASVLALSASAALAQTSTEKAPTPQQKRMEECSHTHKGKHGEEYKSAMRACLKGEHHESKGERHESKGERHESKGHHESKGERHLTPQQEKMKACNKEAHEKDLKGEAHKTFMSTCLKG